MSSRHGKSLVYSNHGPVVASFSAKHSLIILQSFIIKVIQDPAHRQLCYVTIIVCLNPDPRNIVI